MRVDGNRKRRHSREQSTSVNNDTKCVHNGKESRIMALRGNRKQEQSSSTKWSDLGFWSPCHWTFSYHSPQILSHCSNPKMVNFSTPLAY